MKKIVSFFMLICFLSTYLSAQDRSYIPLEEREGEISAGENKSTILPSQIRYWIGEGNNSAILIVNWCDPEIAFAWGYRWDDGNTVTYVSDMMDGIAAEDSRFHFNANSGYVNDITYQDSLHNLSGTSDWMYNIDGRLAAGIQTQLLSNGSIVEWGDRSCVHNENGHNEWNNPISAVTDPDAVTIPEDLLFPEDSVVYWIGKGDNQIVFAVNWCNPEMALAWGYRFTEDSLSVSTVMDRIAARDPRFDHIPGPLGIGDIFFNDAHYHLSLSGNYWMYNINGTMAPHGYTDQYVFDGDMIKCGDDACAHTDEDWNYSWTTPILPAALPEDVSISKDSILFWIGEGDHEVILAINWCDPETCFSWGYRFSADSILVSDMMDSVTAGDPRLSYTTGEYGIGDILYTDSSYTLSLSGSYWLYNLNGLLAPRGFDKQKITDGDFVKWGDEACAHTDVNWNNSWTTPVTPVPVPSSVGIKEILFRMESAIYPNPACDYTVLTLSNLYDCVTMEITDMNGKTIFAEKLRVEGNLTKHISTSRLPRGMYLIRLQSSNGLGIQKLMVY